MTGLVEKKNHKGTRYYENKDGGITAKECTGCEVIKTVDRFNKHKSKFGGLSSCCKECNRKYRQENKEWYAENARKYYQENKENARKYRQENKESIAEKDRKYNQENKERIAERGRKYYQENKERITEYQQENKESIAEYHIKYRQENKENARKHKQENKESIAKVTRKYQQENKELFQIKSAKRRARKRQLPDDLTLEQRNAVLGHFNSSCALTGCIDVIHLDHVIPISIGHGGTTIQNMIPLRADLNMSKNARCIFDWFYDVKDHFKLPQTKFDELIEYLAGINGVTADEYEDYVRWCHDNPRSLDETILDETGSAG